jgi:hypothetical protein
VTIEERCTALEAELAYWQTCANCGERMTGPGICDNAISEREKGLELMHEETLTRAETAESRCQHLEQAIRVLIEDIPSIGTFYGITERLNSLLTDKE